MFNRAEYLARQTETLANARYPIELAAAVGRVRTQRERARTAATTAQTEASAVPQSAVESVSQFRDPLVELSGLELASSSKEGFREARNAPQIPSLSEPLAPLRGAPDDSVPRDVARPGEQPPKFHSLNDPAGLLEQVRLLPRHDSMLCCLPSRLRRSA